MKESKLSCVCFLFCFIICVVNSSLVYGQNNPSELEDASTGNRLFDPSVSSPISSQALSLVLEASKEQKKVIGKIGFNLSSSFKIDLRLSSPISDGQSDVQPLSLNGLGNSAVADFGIQFLAWHPTADDKKRKEIMIKINKKLGRVENEPIKPGDWKDFTEEKFEYDSYVDWNIAWIIGVRGKVGREDFEYSDSSLIIKKDVQKSNKALSLSAGALFDNFLGYLGINYQWSNAYKSNKESEYFLPFDSTNALVSTNLILGEPKLTVIHDIQLEWRIYFDSRIAINPKWTVRVDGSYSFEFPIYFLVNQSGGLSGGIRATFDGESKKYGVSAFIGETLGIIP